MSDQDLTAAGNPFGTQAESRGKQVCPRNLMTAAILVAMSDWLFYGHPFGISAAVFLISLGAGAIISYPVRASAADWTIAAAILAFSVAPLVIQPSLLATAFGVIGAACAATTLHDADLSLLSRLNSAGRLIRDIGWRVAPDLYRAGDDWRRSGPFTWNRGTLLIWIVPLGLGGVFLGLFASANPIIDDGLSSLTSILTYATIPLGRIIGWLTALSLIWPFIVVRRAKPASPETIAGLDNVPISGAWALLFGKQAVVRSLVLFNLLFAVQTGLDLVYLWGPGTLPSGLTYAAYAHRGAYPLIMTALLAAIFVIATTQPGRETAGSRLVRRLVGLWIAQNVLLVVSSILRLHLYVAAYSLTGLRVAAFIWMALVGAGLVLVLVRMLSNRSNAWLLRTNACTVAATLYICCFVNFPSVIATYDVLNCKALAGQGAFLDVYYIESLGPQAIPALDIYMRRGPRNDLVRETRDGLRTDFLTRPDDWRGWTYWDWRLERYIRSNEEDILSK